MSSSRSDLVPTLLIVGVVTAVPAGAWLHRRVSERPTREECERLAERYARFVAQARDPDRPAGRVDPRPGGVSSTAIARCAAEITRSEALCALSAGSADEMERCVR